MITTYIAILLLVIFFSFFIKVKFLRQKKSNPDDVSEYTSDITNDGISSLDLSLLKQMKLHFFRFADLALVEKRPFSVVMIGPDKNANNNLLSSSGDSVNSYTFDNTNYNSKSTNYSISSAEKCYNICKDDPMGQCNAWKYSSNECSKYTLNEKPGFTSVNNENTYGYIRRSPDNWAIKDESGLPSSKKFFKATAKLVNKMGGAPRVLGGRSDRILANENVTYCYRDEPISGDSDDLIKKYREVKAEAIKDLEKVCEYFMFMGNNTLANSIQYIEYAVLCSEILAEFKNPNGSDIFPIDYVGNTGGVNGDCDDTEGLFTEEFCEIIKVAYKFYHDFSKSREEVHELFFNDELNLDNNDYITRDELINYIYKKLIADPDETAGNCEEILEQVKEDVGAIFAIVDSNKDDKISFTEFETDYYQNIMNNKPIRPERRCNGNTEYSYQNDSGDLYNPDADVQFNSDLVNDILNPN